MDLDEDDPAARGLLRYVGLVGDAIGMGAAASMVQLDEPISVYLPLDRCAAEYRDRDLALLWDERCGWALAVESGGGVDLRIAGFLGSGLVPAPRVVADYVDRACHGGGFGDASPPEPAAADLAGLLADYAEPERESMWRAPTRRLLRRRPSPDTLSATTATTATTQPPQRPPRAPDERFGRTWAG